jgi:hypothetical protein
VVGDVQIRCSAALDNLGACVRRRRHVGGLVHDAFSLAVGDDAASPSVPVVAAAAMQKRRRCWRSNGILISFRKRTS